MFSIRFLKKYEEALVWLNQAQKIDKKDAFVLGEKGVCLTINYKTILFIKYLEKYDDAIICFDQALVIDPNQVFSLQEKASCLKLSKFFLIIQAIGKYNEALIWFERSLIVDQENAFTFLGKGKNYLSLRGLLIMFLLQFFLKELGQYSEAIQWYDKALQQYPQWDVCITGKQFCQEHQQNQEAN